jgi:signal transduction histidine kinase
LVENLIINSMNYGGKYISLGYEYNTLFVKDDGIGKPEGQLEKVINAGERLKK